MIDGPVLAAFQVASLIFTAFGVLVVVGWLVTCAVVRVVLSVKARRR